MSIYEPLTSYAEIDRDYIPEKDSLNSRLRSLDDNDLIALYRSGKDSKDENQKDQSKDALNYLIAKNNRLINGCIKSILTNYDGTGRFNQDALYEAGRCGITKALEGYDISKKFKFATYASHFVKAEINKEIKTELETVIVPENIREAIRKIRKYKREHPDHPEAEVKKYLLEEGEIPSENAYKMAEDCMELSRMLSWEELPDSDDVYADEDSSVNPSEYILSQERNAAVEEALASLDDQQKKVIGMLYGIQDGKKYIITEISRELGITPARVRSIHRDALDILKSGPLAGYFRDGK